MVDLAESTTRTKHLQLRPLHPHLLFLSYISLDILTMLVSLTVGKVDAGVAVLLTQDNRLVSSQSPLGAQTPLEGTKTRCLRLIHIRID